jgi:ADP-ribosylation factor-like protein 2
MGLYTILKKHRLKDRQLRLLFLGLDAAGKSTIVARLLSPNTTDSLIDISPTLGFKISTIDFENYKLNICISVCLQADLGDVGGQKTLRAYWKNYFEQTDGVVWVVDSTDRERLHDCAVELHKLLQEEVLNYHAALSSSA